MNALQSYFTKQSFRPGQVVSDNVGAKWIVMKYEFGMVKARPQPDDAYKAYGAVLMPENMLHEIK